MNNYEMNNGSQLRRSARTPKPATLGSNYISGTAAAVAQQRKIAEQLNKERKQAMQQKKNNGFSSMFSGLSMKGGRRRTNRKRKTSKRTMRKRKTMRRK